FSQLLTHANETELKTRAESAYRVVKQRKAGAPDTIRTCDLCLRRAGLLGIDASPQKCKLINRSADSGGLATARFLTLTPPIPRRLLTALGEPKTIALLSVSMDQIIGLTVGSNGRWCPKDSQHDSCLDPQRAGRRS